jgi:hypothetical protein
MRKKTFIYWGAILLTVLLVGIGAMLLGREGGSRATSCLPKPGADVPYFLVERVPGPVESGGSEGPFSLVRSLPGNPARKELMKINVDVPSSFLVTFGGGGQGFWAAIAPGREVLESFVGGRLPDRWAEVFRGNPMEGSSEAEKGVWRLVHPEGDVLFLRVEGNLLLVAENPQELDRMRSSKNGRLESVSSAWRVQPGWMGHLRMSDAGRPDLLPFFGTKDREDDRTVPVTVEAAWRTVPPFGGEGAWVSEGIGKSLSAGKGLLAAPPRWDMKLVFPEPLALALGGVGLEKSLEGESLSGDVETGFGGNHGFWKAWSGLPEERIRRFLRGPIVLSVGGTGRAMGLATPGFLVEFPGRKEEGVAFVRALLGERWGISGLLGREVSGFEVGGAIPLPFTVMAAANRDTAVVGYIEPAALGSPRPLQELSEEFNEPAFSWLWTDGALLSRVLESLEPGSPAFRLLGLEEKAANLELLMEVAGRLGRLSAVMPTPDSGHVTWSGVEPQGGQP